MIVIVDYGMGNLRSVQKAFQKVGQEALITSDPDKVLRASKVVLPGVGAFGNCMANLKERYLIDPINKFIETGKPFLGICLGLQLLLTESEEGGVRGLNIIKGRVKKFDLSNKGLKVPHMGWNQVKCKMQNARRRPTSTAPASTRRRRGEKQGERGLAPPGRTKCKILTGIPDGTYFYFVHSYYVEPDDKNVVTATTEYGLEFISMIHKGNVYGTQFHPEKSQESGLKILKNFGEL